MMRAAGRTFLVLSLVMGLVSPKVIGALLHVMPGVQTLVICTGDRLMRITLNAQGEPVEMTEFESDPCVIADPVAQIADTDPLWHRLARVYTPSFAVRVRNDSVTELYHAKWPSRAPPVTV